MSGPEKIQAAIDNGMKKADENGDGAISKEEFIFIISSIDDSKSDLWISNLYRAFDDERNDKAKWESIQNFLIQWRDHYKEIEEEKYPYEILKVFYQAMDKDRDGNVKLQELIDFQKGFNPNTNVYEEAKKMRKMDENMTGTIQFYEYCKYYGVEVKKNTDAHDGKGKSKCCLLI